VPADNPDFKLTTARELGGAGGEGANPEQLFAAGYSACFLGAMKFVAARDRTSEYEQDPERIDCIAALRYGSDDIG
jgi:organic hydroperoxide reductase OsmC/OhrA